MSPHDSTGSSGPGQLASKQNVGGGIYGGIMQLTADEIDRFWSHVVKGPRETDCWLWAAGGTAAIGDDGYGRNRAIFASDATGRWPRGMPRGQRLSVFYEPMKPHNPAPVTATMR